MSTEIWTSQQARQQDQQAQETGVPFLSLMELAGFQAARLVRRDFQSRALRVAILVGKGANGGDGLVLARHLAAFYSVSLSIVGEPPRFAGAEDLLRAAIAAGARIDPDLSGDMIVDAVYGTGYHHRTRGGPVDDVLDRMYRKEDPIVALDLVSRVDADCAGYEHPIGKNVTTITFGATKWGHWGYPGAAARGKLVLADIGLRTNFAVKDGWVGPSAAKSWLPRLDLLGHKYHRGRVVVIGGSRDMPGAPALAGLAALRAGAGLVTLVVPQGLGSRVQAPSPLLVHEAPAMHGSLRWSQEESELCQKADVVLMGPGLGSQVPPDVFSKVMGLERPLVVDADGLRLLTPGLANEHRAPLILTPHSGEAGELLETSAREIDANRPSAVRALLAKYSGATVILKGAYSVTGFPEALRVNTTGTPEMATPGSGDVLSGIVAGLLAQHLQPIDAAQLATYWHGWAGNVAAKDFGPTLIATDLIEALPRAWKQIEDEAWPPGAPEILV